MYNKLIWGGIIIGVLLPSAALAEQKINQQARISATATGRNSFAASQVHQSAAQNRTSNYAPRTLRDRNLQQAIEQEGQSSTMADGTDNTVIADIIQDSQQHQAIDPQQVKQTATSNAAATGRNNRIITNTGQYIRQNQWSY